MHALSAVIGVVDRPAVRVAGLDLAQPVDVETAEKLQAAHRHTGGIGQTSKAPLLNHKIRCTISVARPSDCARHSAGIRAPVLQVRSVIGIQHAQSPRASRMGISIAMERNHDRHDHLQCGRPHHL